MGFEHRKDTRVKAEFRFFYWLGLDATGPAFPAQADNLSVGGLAFTCGQLLPKDQAIYLEFTPPGSQQLRIRGQILRSEPKAPGEILVRVQFTTMDSDAHLALRRHVMAVDDPKLAEATGWGKAYFLDQRHYPVEYRELPVGLAQKWLEEREYLAAKGVIYLRGFQDFLELYLGMKQPGTFKLMGSKTLKEKTWAWLEVELPEGDLHILAETIWTQQDPGEKAVSGMQVTAYQKEEAMRIEKGPLLP
jgi:hypothetical protein